MGLLEAVQRRNLEAGEALIRAVPPAWLGGVFEVGGWLGFMNNPVTNKQGRHYEYVYPRVSVGDNNMEKLIALTRILGGGVSRLRYFKRNEINNVWTLSQSGLAVCLAEHMQQYAPFRQETILAFLNWENAESAEERLEIAQAAKEEERLFLNVEDYLPLVRIPGFLAGVLDNRGAIVTRKKPYNESFYDTFSLEVNSQNYFLLQALQQCYGGYFGQDSKAESYDWRLGWKKYAPLIENLKGYLKLLQF